MKILLINHQDPDNINEFSGTSYFINRELKSQMDEVVDYHSPETYDIFKQVHEQGIARALKQTGSAMSDFVKKHEAGADFVICQGGNSCIPYYSGKLPLVFWHDSTWHTYLHGYANPRKFDQFKSNYRNLYEWDKVASEKADLLVYSSDYVAEASIRNYGISPGKVKVIPFGANIFNAPSTSFLCQALKKRLDSEIIQLTFLGKDWKRKGLYAAFKLTQNLNRHGIAAMLNIIGCQPDVPEICASDHVKLFGFIDKSDEAQLTFFESVLESTHFLLHPAISEPFGIALCEANAYGIPVICTPVEGLRTIVKHGVNGFLFDIDSFIDEATLIISEIMGDKELSYATLFSNAVAEYHRRLNWTVNVQALKKALLAI